MSQEAIVEELRLRHVRRDDGEPIQVGSPAWFAWLAGATRFRLATPQGLVTVRKERAGSGRGGWYWRAYRKQQGRLRRFYLGPDHELTPEALTAVSVALSAPLSGTPKGGSRSLGAVPNADVEGSETDQLARLLHTRIAAPFLRADLVARPDLVARLRSATTACALTLLVAPAGFGKTTLLVQSLAGAANVAWLTIEGGDNAPRSFLVALCAAVARVQPAAVASASALLSLPYPADTARVLEQLIGHLAGCTAPLTIVLDDYHVLEDHAVHQLVARLVEHAPSNLHLVIASRTTPALPLAGLRVRGLLAELHERELRFGPADAARLIHTTSRRRLSDADLAMLLTRTEGWASGLQLAALALRDASEPARVITAFSGEHRLVADYLLSEVLAGLPAHLRQFLRATAILDRLSAPLCAAVCGDGEHAASTAAQQLLEELEQRGLFLMPLDNSRRWYRYHGLFAELLRAEVARVERPEAIAARHLRAADWYLAQLPSEGVAALEAAISHRLAGGAAAGAATLIERAGLQAVFTGDAETFQRWLRALPSHVVHARPFLRLAAAGHFPLLRHPHIVAQELAFAEAPLLGGSDGENTAANAALVRAEALGVRAFVAQACGELEQAATWLLEALALLPMSEAGLRWRLLVSLGNAYALEGWPAAAHLVLTSSLEAAGDEPVLAFLSRSYRAWVALDMGWVAHAQQTFADLCAGAEAAGWAELPLMGEALLGLGASLAERGQLRDGLASLERGLALMRRMGFNALLIPGELERARICRILGRAAEAQRAVAAATEVARDFAVPFLQARIAAARLDLGLDVASDPPAAGPVLRYEEVPVRLAWARAAIRAGRAGEARAVLAPLLPVAERRRWAWALLSARVLWSRACAAEQDGATQEAVDAAVAQAASAGALLPLLEDGPEGVALLRRTALNNRLVPASAQDAVPAFLAALLAASAQAAPDGGEVGANSESEPLTPREQEVLVLIAAGASNAEIAAQLVVTIGTVKAHSRSIFAKLGVANRTQAARSYHLGPRTAGDPELSRDTLYRDKKATRKQK